jgi:hypothetical protein
VIANNGGAALSPEDKDASQVGWSATSFRRAITATFPDERNAAFQPTAESPSATTYPEYSASPEECERPMMTYLTLVAMLALVLFPLLIPATITAVHAVRRWQPTWAPARMAGYPRHMARRRLAVPAAA